MTDKEQQHILDTIIQIREQLESLIPTAQNITNNLRAAAIKNSGLNILHNDGPSTLQSNS